MVKANYMVLCDGEVMFSGTKDQCLSYYMGLPHPFSMDLIKITNTWNIWKDWEGRLIKNAKIKK